ncbi:hypothetical protein CBL_05711 [Carabus blaptoides fortunei]
MFNLVVAGADLRCRCDRRRCGLATGVKHVGECAVCARKIREDLSKMLKERRLSVRQTAGALLQSWEEGHDAAIGCPGARTVYTHIITMCPETRYATNQGSE